MHSRRGAVRRLLGDDVWTVVKLPGTYNLDDDAVISRGSTRGAGATGPVRIVGAQCVAVRALVDSAVWEDGPMVASMAKKYASKAISAIRSKLSKFGFTRIAIMLGTIYSAAMAALTDPPARARR